MPCGIAKSFFRFFSVLWLWRSTPFSPSVPAFDSQERRRREKFELLLDEALYLLHDDGVWVGISDNTSTMTMDVPESQKIYGNVYTWTWSVGSRSSKTSTLPCYLMTFLDCSLIGAYLVPSSGNGSFINGALFGDSRTHLVKRVNLCSASRMFMNDCFRNYVKSVVNFLLQPDSNHLEYPLIASGELPVVEGVKSSMQNFCFYQICKSCYKLWSDVDVFVEIDGIIHALPAAPNCHCSVNTELADGDNGLQQHVPQNLGPWYSVWKVFLYAPREW